MKEKSSPTGYSVETDRLGRVEWSELVKNFDDATIYQTWSYGAVRWGEKNLSHLVLKKDGKIIAGAQTRIIRIPFLGAAIAYIHRGPCWRLRGEKQDSQTFRQIIRALRKVYVSDQRLLLRVAPNEIGAGSETIPSILREEGFRWRPSILPYRTLLIDLSPTLEELMKGLRKKWRENLRRAQRTGLEIVEGSHDELYEVFIGVYREMHARKKFIEFVDINEFRAIQRDLPEDLKMNIMIATYEGDPVSGLIWSVIGDTGIPIFSATADKGLKLRASYLLRWRMLAQLKERGCRFMDQGGINPKRNPGSYHFKKGMGGVEVCHIGNFEESQSLVSSLFGNLAEKLKSINRNLRGCGMGNITKLISG
ncbi:MAG: peptidoglycan bridge formation glycyltransferase FemA/FemB family protein [Candidatus Aenigmarchaeota archaeon]|nr:peptidoglycan bridge formation glycyltransferase FemA/FemB family protein [Candidatus Aenigmarchaeota archaeon]